MSGGHAPRRAVEWDRCLSPLRTAQLLDVSARVRGVVDRAIPLPEQIIGDRHSRYVRWKKSLDMTLPRGIWYTAEQHTLPRWFWPGREGSATCKRPYRFIEFLECEGRPKDATAVAARDVPLFLVPVSLSPDYARTVCGEPAFLAKSRFPAPLRQKLINCIGATVCDRRAEGSRGADKMAQRNSQATNGIWGDGGQSRVGLLNL